MDTVMAENDFLKEFLDSFTQRMDRIETKLDKNTQATQKVLNEAQYTNGRLAKAEKAIANLEVKKGKKFDLPPNMMYLVALAAVILLIIVAAVLNVNLGGLLK